MSAKTKDPVLLAVGGVALLGTIGWAFLQQSDISGFQTPPTIPSSGAAYESASLTVTSPESRTWAEATSQSAGEKWLYDVFTPPKIYYNTQTKQFTVVPPEPVVGPSTGGDTPFVPPPVTFGLTLVKVEQPLFRLQLVGYIGEGATARGNFENQITKQVVFGTTGKKLPDLNLEIVKFSAERVRTAQPGGTTLVETVVNATVRDLTTGVETKLDASNRVPEGPLAVTFKLDDGTERSAKSGDKIVLGETTYEIGALTLEPPSAVVTKLASPEATPQVETLVIPPPAPPAPAPDAAPAFDDMGMPTQTTPPAAGTAFPGF